MSQSIDAEDSTNPELVPLTGMRRQISFHQGIVDQASFDPLPLQTMASNCASVAPSTATVAMLALATQRSVAGSLGGGAASPYASSTCNALAPLDGHLGLVNLDASRVTLSGTTSSVGTQGERKATQPALPQRRPSAEKRSDHLKPCSGPIRSPSLPMPAHHTTASTPEPRAESLGFHTIDTRHEFDDVPRAIRLWRSVVSSSVKSDDPTLLNDTLGQLQEAVESARKAVLITARGWLHASALVVPQGDSDREESLLKPIPFTAEEESILRQAISESLLPPTLCVDDTHDPTQVSFGSDTPEASTENTLSSALDDTDTDAATTARILSEIRFAKATKALCEVLAAYSHTYALLSRKLKGGSQSTTTGEVSQDHSVHDLSEMPNKPSEIFAPAARLVRDYVLYKILHRSSATTVYLGAQRFSHCTFTTQSLDTASSSPSPRAGAIHHGDLAGSNQVSFDLPVNRQSAHVESKIQTMPFVDTLALSFWARCAAHTDAGIVAVPPSPQTDSILSITYPDAVTTTHATFAAHPWFNPSSTLERAYLEASQDEGKTWYQIVQIPKGFFSGIPALSRSCTPRSDADGYKQMRVLRFPRTVTAAHWRLRLTAPEKAGTHLLAVGQFSLGRYIALKRTWKDVLASSVTPAPSASEPCVPSPSMREYVILNRLTENPFVVHCLDAFQSRSPQTNYVATSGSPTSPTHTMDHDSVWIVTNYVEGHDLLALLASHSTTTSSLSSPSSTGSQSPADAGASAGSTKLTIPVTQSVARFPESIVRKYVAQLAVSLYHMHGLMHIAHMDIKPANIVLDRQLDRVYFVDFRIARIFSDSNCSAPLPKFPTQQELLELLSPEAKDLEERSVSESSGGHLVAGTAEYGAPELFRVPQAQDVSATQADMYSLGVTIFQLLTGHVPYQGYPIPANRGFSLLARVGPERYLATRMHLSPPDMSITSGPRTAGFSVACWDVLDGLLKTSPDQRWNVVKLIRHAWLAEEVRNVIEHL